MYFVHMKINKPFGWGEGRSSWELHTERERERQGEGGRPPSVL